ncbi:hypothetical protein O2W15_07535 [Modestobacter sp. VKM Ac-2979]|uniref:hypothetical protein n=1 Tax=unclassified Modestobacter TaxID=2643866 RepID=UPI0022ABC177|nr:MULTISPECIES: hypothetical protein [unclassified Modestobacter]MCZ2811289.1 hypothetical protein [Modestobacter sp. VKM Ac-2979]MCZ2840802.1 hypothetical protein [Modestobacter sp. VKM Ac-2980]
MATHKIDPDEVLLGVALKVYRARVLSEGLTEEIDRVLSSPTAARPEANADGSFSSIYEPTAEPHPAMSLMLGEFAHNARSALDNLVTALVVRNGGTPKSHHKFPLSTHLNEWTASVADLWPADGPLAGVTREALDLIEDVQPFHADDPTHHPLALVGRVNNADKHQMLHAAISYTAPDADQEVLSVLPATTQVQIIWTPARSALLAHGDEATRFRFVGPAPDEFLVKLNWPLTVVFRDHKGRDLNFTELGRMYEAVALAVRPWIDPEYQA